MRYYYTACCALAAFFLAAGSGRGEGVLSMEDVVARALEKTELILAGKEQVEASKHYQKQAPAFMNPSVELEAGSKHIRGASWTAYGISLAQPFGFPGKRALREARLFVYYETMRLAAAYAIAGQRAEHAGERVARFSLLKKFLSGRPFASPQKRAEKHIVENRIDMFSRELLRIKAEREILWSRLNTFLNMDGKVDIWFNVPAAPPALNRETLEKTAEERNTSLAAIAAGVRKKKLERDLAGKEAYPDFGLTAFYSGETAGERERIIGGGVTFSLPVFNRNSGTVKGLGNEIESEKLRLAFEKRALRERVGAAHREFVIAAEAAAKLPDEHLARMHAQQKEADDAFGKGLLDFVTYLELESDIYDKHQAVFDSRLEYVEKLTQLLWLTGELKNPFKSGAGR